MPITRPYRRTCRPFVGGDYSSGGSWAYVMHSRYAVDPQHYIRAAMILQKDLQELFDYVEPSDKNLPCYSYRIHELLLRACIEIEANCKAILSENGYAQKGWWVDEDYRKIERSHALSQFEVKLPIWSGASGVRRPFSKWASDESTAWYKAYNESKHNRHQGFEKANFENLTDAFCGLVALLSAQFWKHDFVPDGNRMVMIGPDDGFEGAIGELFRVKFPTNIPDAGRYQFNWAAIAGENDPFQDFAY
ncbi:MAG TPA: hypothetical protein VNW30_04825 [Opitutaceae bacterium]|jgi:hypothetical protein|nr:hypothetical protein [Opitutaceae bacterium]